jgi:hypothetical protein
MGSLPVGFFETVALSPRLRRSLKHPRALFRACSGPDVPFQRPLTASRRGQRVVDRVEGSAALGSWFRFGGSKSLDVSYIQHLMLRTPVLTAVGKYLANHPDELARFARNAAALKVGVPLAAFRWLAARGTSRRLPTDVLVEAVPPGVRLGATLELMGAKLRASSLVFVERVRLSSDELRIELRFSEAEIRLLDDESNSPLAALIRSGALDLTRLGNLIAVMPKRPEYLVEAKGDRVVLDLKRHPKLSTQRADLLLRLITPILTITEVSTDGEHLDLKLGVFAHGVQAALDAFRDLL